MDSKLNHLEYMRSAMRDKDKINYFLDIAQEVMNHSNCLYRQCGAIIVSNDQIVSTGYSHIIRQDGVHKDRDKSIYQKCRILDNLQLPKSECYENCMVEHAEITAIMNTKRGMFTDATLYLVGRDIQSGKLIADIWPCPICLRHIIKAGIVCVVRRNSTAEYNVVYLSGNIKKVTYLK